MTKGTSTIAMSACLAALWGLSGCGTSTAQTPTHNQASSTVNSSTKSRTNGAQGSSPAIPNLTLSRLNGLSNYQCQETIMLGPTTTSVIGFVHSSTNYQMESTLSAPKTQSFQTVQREVHGVPYMKLPGVGWQKGTPVSSLPLFVFAGFVMDALKNPHQLLFVRSGTVAGQPCQEYWITSPNAPKMATKIWVENKTDALLKYIGPTVQIPGNAGTRVSNTFTVTRVGSVPAWASPAL